MGDEPDEDDDEALPPGHPPTTGPSRSPAGEQRALPEDTSDVDPDLPPGSIVVEARDASDHPLPQADVNLGIMQQSVAKGESHRRMTAKTDARGQTRFDQLELGGGVAYRVTIPWSGKGNELATYAAFPFQLDPNHGQRVVVHVYPVTSRIEEALVGMQGIVNIELKDDVLQFDELFQVYNLGPVTWVPPADLVIDLPLGFKAFTTQKEMSDTGFDQVEQRGARMRGTFAPGTHETHFRYQVPYDRGDPVELSFTLPPHVAQMKVISEAAKGMTLRVADFPNAEPDKNRRGQNVLVTGRQLRSGQAPMSRLHITLDNLPGPGSTRNWVAAIAACIVVLGIYAAVEQQRADRAESGPRRRELDEDAARARSRLVQEIAALERARESGEIGPSAYARLRQTLIDAIAQIMNQMPQP